MQGPKGWHREGKLCHSFTTPSRCPALQICLTAVLQLVRREDGKSGLGSGPFLMVTIGLAHLK